MQSRKLMLCSWGNFDETNRISAKVRYKQVSSMKLSYFLELFLEQSYMHVCSCNGLSCVGVKALKNHERIEL